MVGGAWAGAEDYERSLRQEARRSCGDRILFLGPRRDVADLYPEFDVAVHPSLSENVGGAVESLVAGIPTIATRVGGFPDLVRDGETGWLVPPRDPERLARAIQAALRNPEEAARRARAGRALALQMFDVEANTQTILELYRRLVG